MLISELTFPHLLAAREERLTSELERRRVVAERLTEQVAAVAAAASASARVERMPRSRRGATSRGPAAAAEPCPACPA